MNRVQFVFQTRNINITKLMTPPISRSNTQAWITQARKVIPQIPDLKTQKSWFVYREVVTEDSICLELNNSIGERCALIIERKGFFSK